MIVEVETVARLCSFNGIAQLETLRMPLTMRYSIFALSLTAASLTLAAINNKRMFGRYFPPGPPRPTTQREQRDDENVWGLWWQGADVMNVPKVIEALALGPEDKLIIRLRGRVKDNEIYELREYLVAKGWDPDRVLRLIPPPVNEISPEES